MTPTELEVLRSYMERQKIKEGHTLHLDMLERMGLIKIVQLKTPSKYAGDKKVYRYALITDDGVALLNSIKPEKKKNWFSRFIDRFKRG
jgi:hypothetical protein